MPARVVNFENLLLGAVSVDLGYIRQEDLDACLREQESSLEPRPLGELLVGRGHLNDTQLEVILREQKRRQQDFADGPLFGQIALRHGFINGPQLGEAIREHLRTTHNGKALPLGQILYKKGYLERGQFIEVLQEQGALRLACPHCRTTWTETPAGGLTCPKCRADLVLPDIEGPEPRRPITEVRRIDTPAGAVTRLGKYEILGEISRGANSVVLKGIDTTLGRTVALKVLKEGDADETFIERLKREARIAARLRHPNVVTIHEVGRLGTLHYLCMDYVAGLELNQFVRERRLAAREIGRLLEKVCRAIHYAHSHGVIHRDLKPANIIVTGDGEPVVTDFGLAKSLEASTRLTKEGTILGTPFYMPPEQVRGELDKIDARSDVYSIGVILYELLTHAYPHDGATVMEVYRSILSDEPPRPRTLQRDLDFDVEAICLKAIDKDPDFRYASAEAMAEDLTRYAAGEPVLATRGSTVRRIARRFRRARWQILTVAGLLLLAGIAVRAALWYGDYTHFRGLFALADEAYAQGQWEDARSRYHEVLALRPNDASVLLRIAECEARIAEVERRRAEDAARTDRERADQADRRERARQAYDRATQVYLTTLRLARDPSSSTAQLRERYDEAIREVGFALQESPTYLEAALLKGRILMETYDPDAAIEAYTQALQIAGGEHFEAAYERAKCHLALWLFQSGFHLGPHPLGGPGLLRGEWRSPQDARAHHEAAMRDLDLAWDTVDRGWTLDGLVVEAMAELAQWEPHGAVVLLTKVLIADPLNVDAQLFRAVAFLMLARPALAVDDAREVVRMQPHNFLAQTVLLVSAIGAGQPGDALDAAQMALAWNDTGVVWAYQGKAFMANGRFEEALHSFREAQRRFGDAEPGILLDVAQALYQLGRLSEGYAVIRQFIDRAPRDADGLHLAALYAAQLNEPARAREWIGRAIGLAPHDSDLLTVAAKLKIQFDDDLPGAEELLRRALAESDRDAEAWYVLGVVRMRLGDPPGGLEAMRNAHTLEPSTQNLLGLARALMVSGRPTEAVRILQEAVDRDPASPPEVRALLREAQQDAGGPEF